MDLTQNINALFEQMEKFFKTDTVFGEAIQVGNLTLIPVISVTFGAGNGGGSGKDKHGMDGNGGGAGAGGRIAPSAVIVIKDDDVSVMPLTNRGSIDKIAEMVPELVSKISTQKNQE